MKSKLIAVVGGGPAGLRAAEIVAAGGAKVTVFDAKPSVGRKFLVAGKGGMNLTHAEPADLFARRYLTSGDSAPAQGAETNARWSSLLADFDADQLRAWASGLGVETFAAGTGRVYPREMKSAPLLRRWVQRLRAMNVQFRMRHQLVGITQGTDVGLHFVAEDSTSVVNVDAAILALGGASWPETGSTGAWTSWLQALGISVAPFKPANCGWECAWSPEVLAACEGKPLKNVRVDAGPCSVRGELMVTSYGLEGGAIYALGSALRSMESPVVHVDLKPDSSLESLVNRLGTARSNFLREAEKRWRLDPAAAALLKSLPVETCATAYSTAEIAKRFPILLSGPRAIEEAISSAGGIAFSELDERLMVRRFPGLFAAGEMLDWEAPTGGYLLQGCFSTGTRVGNGVLRWLSRGE